jgi:MFS-type transporter involved in bile tolerance (Atg22 family)
MQAFVAAQFVHFVSVIIMHTVFAESGVHLGTPEIAIVLIGFTIVSGVGLTAAPLPGHRFRSLFHTIMIYLILLILVADYSQHPTRSLRWFLLPIAAAAVLRHLHRHKPIENAGREVPVAQR